MVVFHEMTMNVFLFGQEFKLTALKLSSHHVLTESMVGVFLNSIGILNAPETVSVCSTR